VDTFCGVDRIPTSERQTTCEDIVRATHTRSAVRSEANKHFVPEITASNSDRASTVGSDDGVSGNREDQKVST